jgi:hypothetical protein
MGVSPKRNAILLQILHHFKANSLLLNVNYYQHRSQHFVHISATWMTKSVFFPPPKSRGTVTQVSQICRSRHQGFLVFNERLPLWPNPTKKSHGVRSVLRGSRSVSPPRPIHRPQTQLSSHARTRSVKCGGVPSRMKCIYS